MRWLKGLFGVIFVALGALWTLQGLNVLQGTLGPVRPCGRLSD